MFTQLANGIKRINDDIGTKRLFSEDDTDSLHTIYALKYTII